MANLIIESTWAARLRLRSASMYLASYVPANECMHRDSAPVRTSTQRSADGILAVPPARRLACPEEYRRAPRTPHECRPPAVGINTTRRPVSCPAPRTPIAPHFPASHPRTLPAPARDGRQLHRARRLVRLLASSAPHLSPRARHGTALTRPSPSGHIIDGKKAGSPTTDRKSTRLNSSHSGESRMPSSA